MENEISDNVKRKIAEIRSGQQQPSKEVEKKLDRIKGKLPELPLSDYVKERLAKMRAKGLISSKPLN